MNIQFLYVKVISMELKGKKNMYMLYIFSFPTIFPPGSFYCTYLLSPTFCDSYTIVLIDTAVVILKKMKKAYLPQYFYILAVLKGTTMNCHKTWLSLNGLC